jgi:TatD DNase family protein
LPIKDTGHARVSPLVEEGRDREYIIRRIRKRMDSHFYVDVHTHLTHEQFANDLLQVITRAQDAGLGAIVVNGLEPKSNREILAMAARHRIVKPALGIYPIDGVHSCLPPDFPFKVEPFSVDEEINFIRESAQKGLIAAVGECGLDGHWCDATTFKAQEKVFEELLDIARTHNIPAIIHSRRLEQRTFEILRNLGVRKANLHCYGGKTKWAIEAAEKDGYWFSIPAHARVSESFQKLLKKLPPEKILTETDAPYLSPIKGTRNEPANVVHTVQLFAELRGLSVEEGRQQIYQNYRDLFEAI